MKNYTNKVLLLFMSVIMMPGITNATIHNVEVEDFEFNPTTFIVNVGDTIHWYWDEGFHTTTSFIIPSGAAPWNQTISSATQTFDYVVTVAGSYDYICSPHASMGMTGHFTALSSTGISENTISSLSLVKKFVTNGELHLEFISPGNVEMSLKLFDIVGQQVIDQNLPRFTSGLQSHSVDVASLPKGIYILSLFAGKSQLSQRILIE